MFFLFEQRRVPLQAARTHTHTHRPSRHHQRRFLRTPVISQSQLNYPVIARKQALSSWRQINYLVIPRYSSLKCECLRGDRHKFFLGGLFLLLAQASRWIPLNNFSLLYPADYETCCESRYLCADRQQLHRLGEGGRTRTRRISRNLPSHA